MTREELIYMGAIQIYSAFVNNPPKVMGKPLKGSHLEEEALTIASEMYGKLPKYIKYSKKKFKENQDFYQITDEEIK